jgi:hypothetical protein
MDDDRSNYLTDLAHQIKAEHEAVGGAMKRGAEHAIKAGELLIEAKAQVQHGQWLPWLREHCKMSERTAQLYMRLAKANPQHVADMTLRGAMSALGESDEERYKRLVNVLRLLPQLSDDELERVKRAIDEIEEDEGWVRGPGGQWFKQGPNGELIPLPEPTAAETESFEAAWREAQRGRRRTRDARENEKQ